MSEYDIKRLALIIGVQAEIEGMKIDNLIAIQEGYPPVWSHEKFEDKSFELRNIAYIGDSELHKLYS